MGGSIGQSALVYQGQTWHSMLRAGGLRWTGAAQDDMGLSEREWLEALSLLRNNVLSEKGRSSPSRSHLDFYCLAHGRRSAGYLSAPACALHADRCGHRTGRYGVHIKPVIGPSRGGQARGPGSGSPRAEPGAPTSSPFDFAALRSGRPLEDFPSLGTPSRARAHGQRPWPESRGRNNRYGARLIKAAIWLSGVGAWV